MVVQLLLPRNPFLLLRNIKEGSSASGYSIDYTNGYDFNSLDPRTIDVAMLQGEVIEARGKWFATGKCVNNPKHHRALGRRVISGWSGRDAKPKTAPNHKIEIKTIFAPSMRAMLEVSLFH